MQCVDLIVAYFRYLGVSSPGLPNQIAADCAEISPPSGMKKIQGAQIQRTGRIFACGEEMIRCAETVFCAIWQTGGRAGKQQRTVTAKSEVSVEDSEDAALAGGEVERTFHVIPKGTQVDFQC